MTKSVRQILIDEGNGWACSGLPDPVLNLIKSVGELLAYQDAGGPEFPDWDEKFEKLEEDYREVLRQGMNR